MSETVTEEIHVRVGPVPVVEPLDAEARFDALCLWYFGRELYAHTVVRRRTLDLLTDPACREWPWGCVQAHCGLSENFLTLVYEGLRDGVAAAQARAEPAGQGSPGSSWVWDRDPRFTEEAPDATISHD